MNAELLSVLTDLIGKQADVLLALANLYGVVVLAVIGWIVNTGKDGPGVSWVRIILFNLGFVIFFVAHFAALWYVYDRFEQTMALWAQSAMHASPAQKAAIEALTWLPPKEYLFALWGLNLVVLILATILLREGGYGRKRGG